MCDQACLLLSSFCQQPPRLGGGRSPACRGQTDSLLSYLFAKYGYCSLFFVSAGIWRYYHSSTQPAESNSLVKGFKRSKALTYLTYDSDAATWSIPTWYINLQSLASSLPKTYLAPVSPSTSETSFPTASGVRITASTSLNLHL